MNENKDELDKVLEDQEALDSVLMDRYKGDQEKVKYMKDLLLDRQAKSKKLTVRLDEKSQQSLKDLQERFPSLSQNQILNHVIEYGADKMIQVVGKGNPEEHKSELIIKSDKVVFINSKGEEFEVLLKPGSNIKIEKSK